VSLRVIYEEKAINQAAGFLADDPAGSARCWTPLTGWPMILARAGSFPYGSPGLRRLRAGRYRALYEISGDVVSIGHIARGTASG
jgi:mRNA interferase RelE/StbE